MKTLHNLTLHAERKEKYLVAICASVSLNRLAYYLNEKLDLRLQRRLTDIVQFSPKAYFKQFQYIDDLSGLCIDLLQNYSTTTCSVENEHCMLPIGDNLSEAVYLLPELSKIDYIASLNKKNKTQALIKALNENTFVMMCYQIKPNQIKTNLDFLENDR